MKYLALLAVWLSVPIAFAQGVCPANPNPGHPQVCIRWTAAPLANIYRAVLPGTENYILPPLNAAPTASPYIDSTVLPSTSYYYTAVQIAGGLSSAPSSEVGAQIPVPPSQPQNPQISVQ
jgi:hypothetical protein